MLPIYQKLISAGLRVLVYSGVNDMAVNTLGTEESVNILQAATKANVVDEWRSWHHDGQVAGWTQKWDNDVTFVTVRGAGHMVPTSRPGQSLVMYEPFFNNHPIPH